MPSKEGDPSKEEEENLYPLSLRFHRRVPLHLNLFNPFMLKMDIEMQNLCSLKWSHRLPTSDYFWL